jgi:hypothetical protein
VSQIDAPQQSTGETDFGCHYVHDLSKHRSLDTKILTLIAKTAGT